MTAAAQRSLAGESIGDHLPERTAVLAVGMHRSGTSALARVLALLGATLPEQLVGAMPGNTTGHWEPKRLVALHDQMLEEAGSRWDDWRPLSLDALGAKRRAHYESAIVALIAQEYGSAPLFVLKDPRISRFMPFYLPLLESMGVTVRVVVAYRNPTAVVKSLAVRDNMTADFAALVWLRHAVDAEEGSRGTVRSFVAYEDLLRDWPSTVARVGRELELEWPASIDAQAAAIEAFVSPGLAHQTADPDGLRLDKSIASALASTHAALRRMQADPLDVFALDALRDVRAQLDPGNRAPVDATFAEMTARRVRAVRERKHLESLVEKADAERASMERERDRLLAENARRRSPARLGEATATAQKTSAMSSTDPPRPLRRNRAARRVRGADLLDRVRVAWRYPRIPQLLRLPAADAERVATAFDAAFYRERYPDIAAAGTDPFTHFMRHGWKEGRDPSAAFSTRFYQAQAPDVALAGINPLVHWVMFGEAEQRRTLPTRQRLALLDYAPLVSVVVPNYNHARFLEQRLDLILEQTYRRIEIIILDDASTDDSRSVIERYAQRYPELIRTDLNEVNSGGVFRQWRRGIEDARGELVWICESDDFCEPSLLAALVPHFADQSVNLAFGRIQGATEDGQYLDGLDRYRETAEPKIWDTQAVRPASAWFTHGFGIRNVIANVGGCVFRRQSLPDSVWNDAMSYRTIGDWLLYVHLARGGQIAYEPRAVSYFRQHPGNSSAVASLEPTYYVENERFMRFLRNTWDVPDETVEAFLERVAYQYSGRNLEPQLGPLSNYCDRSKLFAEHRQRPHVLMCLLAFQYGGGEVFPIDLANALAGEGVTVSIFVLDDRDPVREMRDRVMPGIAVYSADFVEEYGVDRFIEDAGISVIHSHMVSVEDFFFSRCAMRSEVPYLVTLHGSYEANEITPGRLQQLTTRVTHFAYLADKNIAPLRELGYPASRFTKIGNARPRDDRPFEKTRAQLGISDDAVVFTLVARGIPRKGWRAAIEAFRSLRAAHPERRMHLLLAGEGEQTVHMRRLHESDPDITFLGFQERIQGLFRISDVALLPSRFAGESFPLVVIEALLTGTPIISTRIGSIPEMVDGPEGAAGILIENERDTQTFIHRLEEAMSAMLDVEIRERYAAVAVQLHRSYEMDAVARRYREVYRGLVGASGTQH